MSDNTTTTGPKPLRGREVEAEALRARLRDYASRGVGGGILLVGVKGVGKTSLLAHVEDMAKSEISARVVKSTLAGRSLEAWLLGRLGLGADADAREREARLREVLTDVFDDRRVGDVAAVLGRRMGLTAVRSSLRELHAEPNADQYETELAVWRRFVAADAAKNKSKPLVLIFDDLGAYPDDERALVEGLAAAGNVLVVSSATAFPSDDKPRASDAVFRLGPLSGRAAREVVADRIGHCPDTELLGELQAAVQDYAGGHPGLIEQALRTYEKLGVVEKGPVLTHIVPEKLVAGAVAMSPETAAEYRLYKLRPDVQEVLGWAAALGSVFWSRAVITACRHAEGRRGESWGERARSVESRVARALDVGVRSGVLLQMGENSKGGDSDVEYAFRGNHERQILLRHMSAAARARVALAHAEYMSGESSTHTHEDSLRALADARKLSGDHRRAGEAFAIAAEVAKARGALARAVDAQAEAIKCFSEASGADGELGAALEKQLDLLVATRSFELVIRTAEELLDVSFRLVRRASAAFALARKGRAYRELGQARAASDAYREACELFRAEGDARGEASMLDELGRIAWLEGDTAAATTMLDASLAIRRALGESRLIAMSSHNLGLVAKDRGEYGKAAEYFQEALRARRDVGEIAQASASLIGLVRARMAAGELQLAVRAVDEVSSLYAGVTDTAIVAPVRALAADLAAAQSDWALAHGLYKDAERLAAELGDTRLAAEVRGGLVRATLALGDARASYELALDGVARARQWGDPSALAGALRLLADVHGARGDHSEAERALGEANVLEAASPTRAQMAMMSMPPTGR